MTFREGGAQSVQRGGGKVLALIVLAAVATYGAYEWGRPWLATLVGGSDVSSPDVAVGSVGAGSEGDAAANEVDSLVSARAADVESEIRARMERDLEAMRQKVEEAKRAATVREDQREQGAPAAVSEAATRAPTAPTGAPTRSRPSTSAAPPRRPVANRGRAAARGQDPERAAPRRLLRPGATGATSMAGSQFPRQREDDQRAVRPRPDPAYRPSPRIGSSLSRQSSPPRRLNSPSARYPIGAGDGSRAERLVPVRVWIDERGRVISAALRRSTNSVFDEPALRTAQETRFVPATANGAAVASSVTLLIHFRR